MPHLFFKPYNYCNIDFAGILTLSWSPSENISTYPEPTPKSNVPDVTLILGDNTGNKCLTLSVFIWTKIPSCRTDLLSWYAIEKNMVEWSLYLRSDLLSQWSWKITTTHHGTRKWFTQTCKSGKPENTPQRNLNSNVCNKMILTQMPAENWLNTQTRSARVHAPKP